MGSHWRRRHRVNDEEDFARVTEDAADTPTSLTSKLKDMLVRLFRCTLPEMLPLLIFSIITLILSMILQSYNQHSTADELRSNLTSLQQAVNSRLENVEKVLMKLAQSCGNDYDENKKEDVETTVKRYIRKYDADKTGMIDWAAESLGGSVECVGETKSYVLGHTSVVGIPCNKFSSDPTSIIRPSTMPGDCWAFVGQGTVVIKLAATIFITNVSLEHIPYEMVLKRQLSSAPMNFELWGLGTHSPKHNFGNFQYDCHGDPVQTFKIQNPSNYAYDTVRFNFQSNHGNKEFTCVYRVRIHGELSSDSCND